jgi:transposase-like protein
MTNESDTREQCLLCGKHEAEQTEVYQEPVETGAPGYEVQYKCHACKKEYEVQYSYNIRVKPKVVLLSSGMTEEEFDEMIEMEKINMQDKLERSPAYQEAKHNCLMAY